MTLLKWLTFLIESLIVILTVLLVWIYLILLTTAIVLQWLSLHREILITLLSQFPMAFLQTQKRATPFHRVAYDYSCANWDGLTIMFRGRISLNSVLPLMLMNFKSGIRLGLMYIFLIVNIRSRLTNLHGFQLLVLLQ